MKSIEAEGLSKRYVINGPSGFTAPRLGVLGRRGTGSSDPGVRKPPREIWALKDVSFSVEPGTVLGVIGLNGAGKTTLLKLLGRVTLPTEGRAVVRGRVVTLLEVGAGFQPELTGRANIFLNAALYGIPRSEVLARLEDIVEFAEIRDFIDVPVKRYSSGMYLRLAFSVAINMRPDVLLADEVLAVGDLAFQERCLQRVERAGSSGMTVLFVSHDMGAIRRLCQRVLWLDSGRVVADGETHAVVSQYESSVWKRSAERTDQGVEERYISDEGELQSCRLLAAEDGREIGAARASDELILKVVFRVFRPGAIVRCIVDLYTGGVHVFRSLQPRSLTVSEPGVFSASMRIPANLLADTVYTARIRVLDDQEPGRHLIALDSLTFRVYDTDDSDPHWANRKKSLPVVVMPRLSWEVAREPEVVTA